MIGLVDCFSKCSDSMRVRLYGHSYYLTKMVGLVRFPSVLLPKKTDFEKKWTNGVCVCVCLALSMLWKTHSRFLDFSGIWSFYSGSFINDPQKRAEAAFFYVFTWVYRLLVTQRFNVFWMCCEWESSSFVSFSAVSVFLTYWGGEVYKPCCEDLSQRGSIFLWEIWLFFTWSVGGKQ